MNVIAKPQEPIAIKKAFAEEHCQAEAYPGKKGNDDVVPMPANFNESQRQVAKDACEISVLSVLLSSTSLLQLLSITGLTRRAAVTAIS